MVDEALIGVGRKTAQAATFQVPPAQLRRFQRELRRLGDRSPRAMSTAIRTSVNAAHGQLAKAIGGPQGILNLPAKIVRERGMTKRFEREGTNITGAQLSMHGARFSIARFGARQTRKGVAYKIDRRGARKTITAAWIADPASKRPLGVGSVGKRRDQVNVVFVRPTTKRRPIAAARGPSVGEVALESSEVRRLATDEFGKRLVHEAGRQVDRLLRRRD